MAEVGARVPAVKAQLRQQALVEPDGGRVVAGRVAAGRDRGQQQQRRAQQSSSTSSTIAEAQRVRERPAPRGDAAIGRSLIAAPLRPGPARSRIPLPHEGRAADPGRGRRPGHRTDAHEGARAPRLPGRRHHLGRRGAREVRGRGLRRGARRPGDAGPRRRGPVRDAAAPLPGAPDRAAHRLRALAADPRRREIGDGGLHEAGADPGPRGLPAARARRAEASRASSRRRRPDARLFGLAPRAPARSRARGSTRSRRRVDGGERQRPSSRLRCSWCIASSRQPSTSPASPASSQSTAARSWSPARLARQASRSSAGPRTTPAPGRERAAVLGLAALVELRPLEHARQAEDVARVLGPSPPRPTGRRGPRAPPATRCPGGCARRCAPAPARRGGARSRSRPAGSPRRGCRRGAGAPRSAASSDCSRHDSSRAFQSRRAGCSRSRCGRARRAGSARGSGGSGRRAAARRTSCR